MHLLLKKWQIFGTLKYHNYTTAINHYAESFTQLNGSYFRLIQDLDGESVPLLVSLDTSSVFDVNYNSILLECPLGLENRGIGFRLLR